MNAPLERSLPTLFSWFRDDVECKCGFRGGRFTRVNNLLWLVVAAVLTVGVYSAAAWFSTSYWAAVLHRSWTQYAVVLLWFWCLMILLIKALKLRVQRRALGFTDLVPAEADFVLSAATAEDVLATLRENCDDPTRFILFNRIDLALSNLKNMGNIADVDEVFQSQADNDEGAMESSYSLLRGLIWAMPVLGFIGTVIGLSDAIGNFSGVLSETADPAGLADELRKVTDGLATAFDTTLVALVAALAIQLLMTVVHKSEEELLDDCKEYCQRRVVGKMRLTPFDRV